MIENLAAVVEAVDNAAKDPQALCALCALLANENQAIFDGAMVFKCGYGSPAFVLIERRETDWQVARAWLRWPLRRLFTRMNPTRIAHPVTGDSYALAIPFAHSSARYLVLAPLTPHGASKGCKPFFDVLEHIRTRELRRESALDSNIPSTPMEPNVLGFALCDDLRDRVDAVLGQRGWSMRYVRMYADFCRKLKEAAPDIIAVDADQMADVRSALTSIHRAADSGSVRTLVFTREPLVAIGTESLVDGALPHDADAESIFVAIKGLATESSVFRRSDRRNIEALAARDAKVALNLAELATFAAHRSAQIMSGWACAVLINENGAVYRAEYPTKDRPILSRIPRSFLDDAPDFELRVGDRFLGQVTGDLLEQNALASLQPGSGASLPIVVGSEDHRGVIVACSLGRSADSEAFRALKVLSKSVVSRYEELRPKRIAIPEFSRDRCWDRVRDRAFGLEVYRSTDCRTPWQYRALSEEIGLLTLGLADADGDFYRQWSDEAPSVTSLAKVISISAGSRAVFAGAIDFQAQAMNYATNGFLPPVVLGSERPSSSMGTCAGITSGNAILGSRGEALICNATMWDWFSAQRGKGDIRALLDCETPAGFATIVTLG